MKRIDVMMGEVQKSMNERTTQLQSLRNQLETLKRSLDGEASSAKVMERCSSEMKKMQEKVNAEYARKLKLIQQESAAIIGENFRMNGCVCMQPAEDII